MLVVYHSGSIPEPLDIFPSNPHTQSLAQPLQYCLPPVLFSTRFGVFYFCQIFVILTLHNKVPTTHIVHKSNYVAYGGPTILPAWGVPANPSLVLNASAYRQQLTAAEVLIQVSLRRQQTGTSYCWRQLSIEVP